MSITPFVLLDNGTCLPVYIYSLQRSPTYFFVCMHDALATWVNCIYIMINDKCSQMSVLCFATNLGGYACATGNVTIANLTLINMTKVLI